MAPLHDTKARLLLLQVLQITTVAEVAARLRVFESTVREWAAGHHLPKEEQQVGLENIYRIPRKYWSLIRRPYL